MLGETIKQLRKQKGITQEELAIRLHVVRQTISKWEKNLSVPDSELLVKLAEELDVSVNELLGADIKKEPERNEIVEQLVRINEQLAVRNRRSRRIWTVVAVVLGVFIFGNILLVVLGLVNFHTMRNPMSVSITMSAEDPEFTEAEVNEAIDMATAYFKRNFKGCSLQNISYDEDYSRERAEEWKAQYDADEAIVLLSSFTTDGRGGNGSLNANSTYKDWQWILTRKNGGKWELKTWGY